MSCRMVGDVGERSCPGTALRCGASSPQQHPFVPSPLGPGASLVLHGENHFLGQMSQIIPGCRRGFLGSFGALTTNSQLSPGADCTPKPPVLREAPVALLHIGDGSLLLLLLLWQGPGSSAWLAPPQSAGIWVCWALRLQQRGSPPDHHALPEMICL